MTLILLSTEDIETDFKVDLNSVVFCLFPDFI